MALPGANSRTSDDLAGFFPNMISALAVPASGPVAQARASLVVEALPVTRFCRIPQRGSTTTTKSFNL
jgi:hypothetical protein